MDGLLEGAPSLRALQPEGRFLPENDGPMDRRTRISAVVSRTTRESLERYAREMGVRKGHLVEQALRHHLQALQELPANVTVHTTVVLTRKSGEGL